MSGSHEEMIEAKCSPHCSFFVFGIKSREKGTWAVHVYRAYRTYVSVSVSYSNRVGDWRQCDAGFHHSV